MQHTSGGNRGSGSSRGLGLGGLRGGSRGGRSGSRLLGAHVKLLLGRLLESSLELGFQVIEGVERWMGSRKLSAIRIAV